MNKGELADAQTDPKVKLRSYGELLQKASVSLYPKREDYKAIDNANDIMIAALEFLPLGEHLPKDMTDERAVVDCSRIDGMLDFIKVFACREERCGPLNCRRGLQREHKLLLRLNNYKAEAAKPLSARDGA